MLVLIGVRQVIVLQEKLLKLVVASDEQAQFVEACRGQLAPGQVTVA